MIRNFFLLKSLICLTFSSRFIIFLIFFWNPWISSFFLNTWFYLPIFSYDPLRFLLLLKSLISFFLLKHLILLTPFSHMIHYFSFFLLKSLIFFTFFSHPLFFLTFVRNPWFFIPSEILDFLSLLLKSLIFYLFLKSLIFYPFFWNPWFFFTFFWNPWSVTSSPSIIFSCFFSEIT